MGVVVGRWVVVVDGDVVGGGVGLAVVVVGF